MFWFQNFSQRFLGRPFSHVTTGRVHRSRDHFKEIFRLSRKCLAKNTYFFHKSSRSVARRSEEYIRNANQVPCWCPNPIGDEARFAISLHSFEMCWTGRRSSDGEGRHALYFDKDLPRLCGVALHREHRTINDAV
jgi:hypothetical protein